MTCETTLMDKCKDYYARLQSLYDSREKTPAVKAVKRSVAKTIKEFKRNVTSDEKTVFTVLVIAAILKTDIKEMIRKFPAKIHIPFIKFPHAENKDSEFAIFEHSSASEFAV